ncbi:hypothetical protein F4604DRAFT_1922424 [Suillus subluteus]|nr:hypothetical protein F4604DRAFT_1922424 [Suillus subluteus]
MSHRNTVSLLLPRDKIIQQEFDVKDKESSIAFLAKSPFRQPGDPISNENLTLTILHITQYTAHIVAAISPQVASILTTTESLKTNVDSITEIKNAMESLTSPHSATQLGTLKSYSAIVQQNAQTLVPVSAALVRAATKDQQILFDPAPGQTLFAPEATSTDIANKMKQALMVTPSDDTPEINIKATTRLRNGGLIVELTSVAAANWVRRPENHLNIANALGNTATIKDRCFSIIVPFLPVTSSIEDPAWLCTVEEENDMSPGAIEMANWIKPLQRRAPD